MAYSPLGSPGTPLTHPSTSAEVEGRTGSPPPPLLKHPTVLRVASAVGKSAAQTLLRWNLQRGVAVITKSTHPQRIRSNFDVFDFELTESQVAQINAMQHTVRFGRGNDTWRSAPVEEGGAPAPLWE